MIESNSYVTYINDPNTVYQVLGCSIGAGISKDTKLIIYQSLETKLIFHRTLEDFYKRMVPYNDN